MKIKKSRKEAHTSGDQFGSYYGTGYRQKIGRMRSDSVGYRPVSKDKLKSPPGALA